MLIIYTKTGCPWCVDAINFLLENNIPFEERNVFANSIFFQELEEKTGQQKCPSLDFNGKILADAGVEEIKDFLIQNNIIN